MDREKQYRLYMLMRAHIYTSSALQGLREAKRIIEELDDSPIDLRAFAKSMHPLDMMENDLWVAYAKLLPSSDPSPSSLPVSGALGEDE